MSSASCWRQPRHPDREFPGQSLNSLTMQRIGVVGCGLMGSGIAEVCARAGLDVVVVESEAERAEGGHKRLQASLERGEQRGKIDDAAAVLARITLGTDPAAMADRDLVVEAIA